MTDGATLAMANPQDAMNSPLASTNSAHFTASSTRESGRTTANRERLVTPVRTTLCLAVLGALVSACGGGAKPKDANTYARAASAQQECCEHAGANRDSCLKDIVQVEASVQESAQNQATYACVVEHFTCDPASGHATQPSAQAQLDCIQDLH
ncbi:hypothetical protein BH11MYX1_BH11MYX1_15660 [soil metagenome]